MPEVFTYTEAGERHANEDAFVVATYTSKQVCHLYAVADGQGGRAGGAEAATLACQATIEAAKQLTSGQLQRTANWKRIFSAAGNKVHADANAGFTTLTAACVVGNRVFGASSGDSQAWLTSGGGQAVQLTAKQSKNPPVGSGAAAGTPFYATLKTPWRLVLVTDGVWKYTGVDPIVDTMQTTGGKMLIETLSAAARLPRTGGLQDDFTIVVVENAA